MGRSTPSAKPEFPPLLDIGRHTMPMDELRELCVDGFPTSERRPILMQNLRRVITALEYCGVIGELWINGSFLTQKTEPDDVDLLLFFDGLAARNRPRMRYGIQWFKQPAMKSVLWLHAKTLADYRKGPAKLAKWTEHWHSYWVRQWGFSRSDDPKGFVVHRLVRRDLSVFWRQLDCGQKPPHDGPWKSGSFGRQTP